MKTPKRITYCGCGCALNLESGDYMDEKGKSHNAAALFCPKCGAAHRGEAFASRCIRRNREARLRHALRKMNGILDYAAKEVQRMENEAREEYEHQLRLRLSLAALRTLNNFQRESIHVSGTFGQDIEGS